MVTAVVIAAHEIMLEPGVPGSIGALVLIVNAAQESGVMVMLCKTQQPILRRSSRNWRSDFRLNCGCNGACGDHFSTICERRGHHEAKRNERFEKHDVLQTNAPILRTTT